VMIAVSSLNLINASLWCWKVMYWQF